jgi:PPM family protein phosphatase
MSEKEKLTFSYFGSSNIGLIRAENQDSFGKFPPNDFNLYSEKGQLFIVADGMGGHAGGKEASSIAVNTINDIYFSSSSDSLSSLKEAVEKANNNIYNKSENSNQLKGMGTTCTVLILKEDKGLIAHIGDSRIYMIENYLSPVIDQLTEDHTKVHEMVKEGILTEKEAKIYPAKSVLSRALGVGQKANSDFKSFTIKKDQCYVMCSDGLAEVTKNELAQIVSQNSPEDACEKLINLSNERGGKDNVTVIVIKIGSNKVLYTKDSSLIPGGKKKNYLLPIAALILFLILIAIGISYKRYIIGFFNPGNSQRIPDKVSESQNIKKNSSDQKADAFNSVQLKADNLFKKGKYEDALIVYKKILQSEPMHLGALQGINNIAAEFLNIAEKFKSENKLDNAIKYYRKALEIQPGNQRIEKLITDCKARLQR